MLRKRGLSKRRTPIEEMFVGSVMKGEGAAAKTSEGQKRQASEKEKCPVEKKTATRGLNFYWSGGTKRG